MQTLKHTWRKGLDQPIEIKVHINDDGSYWIEVNGCQEHMASSLPNTN